MATITALKAPSCIPCNNSINSIPSKIGKHEQVALSCLPVTADLIYQTKILRSPFLDLKSTRSLSLLSIPHLSLRNWQRVSVNAALLLCFAFDYACSTLEARTWG
ncbi:hypothetical protein OIU85_000545 [Salix viminalis]|uniref:Uncharacterized protein n=1 Tax=Salix viminalis TaxID=40686 RepID=A0A9Q0VJQ0_SALVM|nr:hypothetical protein OIU85_000545 [Salix viminalis]